MSSYVPAAPSSSSSIVTEYTAVYVCKSLGCALRAISMELLLAVALA